jgi:hypothetical protein
MSIWLGLNCSYAQSSGTIAVPLLKAGVKIDSLMDILAQQGELADHSNDKVSNDSCWMIEMRNMKTYISFQILKNTAPVINSIVNWMDNKKANYGYFEYKGNKIFVWTEDNFHDFFNKSPELKRLNFIHKLGADEPFPSDDLIYRHVLHYKYQDGQFSIEGPPPVKALIK